MKWTLVQPILGVGNACFEPQVNLLVGPAIVNIETNARPTIQVEAAYIRSMEIVIASLGNYTNVRGIDTVASHKW